MEFGGRYLMFGLVLVVIVGLYVGYTLSINSGAKECSVGPKSTVPSNTGKGAVVNEAPGKSAWDGQLDRINISNGSHPVENESALLANMTENRTAQQLDEITPASTNSSPQDDTEPRPAEMDLLFFWEDGCPNCAAAEPFIDGLEVKYPELTVKRYEVSKDQGNLDMLRQICSDRRLECGSVPVTVIGKTAFDGFRDAEGELVRYAGSNSYVGYKNQMEKVVTDWLGIYDGWNSSVLKDPSLDELKAHLSFEAYTDKSTYYEGEDIWIVGIVRGDVGINKLKLVGKGIEGKFDQEESFDFFPAENRIALMDTAPACFNCANFQPGEYDIDVLLQRYGQTIDSVTLTVRIKDSD